jgi:hypothetical protein
MVLHLSRHQSVLCHGGNQPGELDVDPFVFKEAPMNRHEKRQVAHGVTGQSKLDLVRTKSGSSQSCHRDGNANSRNNERFVKNTIVHESSSWVSTLSIFDRMSRVK